LRSGAGAKQKAVFALIAALSCGAAGAQEKTLHVLLSADPNAPSAQQLVEGYDFASGSPPPLTGLAAESPQAIGYLIPQRASGTFEQYLEANPQSPRARLERYVVVTYPPSANLANAIAALSADQHVDHVHEPLSSELALPAGSDPLGLIQPSKSAGTPWDVAVGLPAAWQKAGGWSLVGVIDNGIAVGHPDLMSFQQGIYTGGNVLPSLSFDVGWSADKDCAKENRCIEPNVDEAQPYAVAPSYLCDADADGWAVNDFAGHGTHVAGLIAANATNAGPTHGTCQYCGLAIWRVTRDGCGQDGFVRPTISPPAVDAAITLLADLGAQVINQSLRSSQYSSVNHCQLTPLDSECLALAHAKQRGVLLVAAAGNNRQSIGFPASDPGVITAGGLGTNLEAWNFDPDPPPQNLDQCPQKPAVTKLGDECGTNFTTGLASDRRQEAAAPAVDMVSTVYPGLNWHNGIHCGDSYDGLPTNGVGPCTGTSMSSPVIAGIAGLLRSINPLVLQGDPEVAGDALGIRDVMASTSVEAQSGAAWDPHKGYGRPDAAAAARRMLGTVRGTTARNRPIPLFDFYSAQATDYAMTATPQIAMTLAITEPWTWSPRGPAIAGYPAYPIAPNGAMPAPQASAYVLSTEYRTDSKQPPLIPLYLLSRSRPWPLGCTPGTFQCNHANRDFTLVSTVPALEAAVAAGYAFLGRQGYVFQRCTPEPSCIPPAATRLYRQCNTAEDDCAVFLEHELAAFQSLGYTTAWPPGSDPVMGYAYANVDTDGDTLIDGFERLIGTNAASADSDGDNTPDGLEYPLAGVPLSDPCAGPTITCTQQAIFQDGYE
jgi:subtilisin family serine protease